ncbi:MAG: transposase zinc-binding domain-containing protein [Desulfitobacteriia bacterium]
MGQPLPKAVRVLWPHVLDVIYKYLDCGDLHQGSARVKCNDCNHEYLLPFSCKRRSFCPTCHQKRVVEFGEHLHEEVLEDVAHRQWVFSLPKRLQPGLSMKARPAS